MSEHLNWRDYNARPEYQESLRKRAEAEKELLDARRLVALAESCVAKSKETLAKMIRSSYTANVYAPAEAMLFLHRASLEVRGEPYLLEESEIKALENACHIYHVVSDDVSKVPVIWPLDEKPIARVFERFNLAIHMFTSGRHSLTEVLDAAQACLLGTKPDELA